MLMMAHDEEGPFEAFTSFDIMGNFGFCSRKARRQPFKVLDDCFRHSSALFALPIGVHPCIKQNCGDAGDAKTIVIGVTSSASLEQLRQLFEILVARKDKRLPLDEHDLLWILFTWSFKSWDFLSSFVDGDKQ